MASIENDARPAGVLCTDTMVRVAGMVPYPPYLDLFRLFNLEDVVWKTRDVPGAIVEGGVGLGVTLATFYILCEAFGLKRKMFGFDSFEGLPPPHEHDLGSDRALAKAGDLNYGGEATVMETLKRAGVPDSEDGIKLVKGWFDATMSAYDGPQVAILHVDCDLYESTKVMLECFWDRLAVGGIVVFDEYDNTAEWPGESKAADEFFARIPHDVHLYRDRFGLRYNAIKLR